MKKPGLPLTLMVTLAWAANAPAGDEATPGLGMWPCAAPGPRF